LKELDDGDDDDDEENDDDIEDGGELIIEFNSHSELLSRLVEGYCGQGGDDVVAFEIFIEVVVLEVDSAVADAAKAAAAAASAAAFAELTTGVI
jgi:hypothetical protein